MNKDQALRVIRGMVLAEAERWPEKMPGEIAKLLGVSKRAVLAAGVYWQAKEVVIIDHFGRMLKRNRAGNGNNAEEETR